MGSKNNQRNRFKRKYGEIKNLFRRHGKHGSSQGQSRAESPVPKNDPVSHPAAEINPSIDNPTPPNEAVGYLEDIPRSPPCISSDHAAHEQVTQSGPSQNTANQTRNADDVLSHVSQSDIPTYTDNKAAGKEAASRSEGANDFKELLGPNQLWVAAYNKLSCDDPRVLGAYKQFLLGKGDKSQPEDGNWQARIQELAKARLKANQEERLSFRVGEKEVVVRDQLQTAMNFIVTTKDLVAAAISSEPHAALAWAGVMFVFPLLNTMLEQDDDAIQGFGYILNLLIRCKVMENDFLQPTKKDSMLSTVYQLLLSLQSKTIELYSNIYRYQIRVILHFDRSTFSRYLTDLLVSDDWKGMVQSLKDTEAAINHDLQSLSSHTTIDIDKKLQGFWSEAKELYRMATESIKDTQVISLLSSLPVAHSAAFNSLDRGRERLCTPGTQMEILQRLQDWVKNDEGKLILWLHGMAGTGKSTIAQTVATALSRKTHFADDTRLPDNIFLGATFFFKRDDVERSHAGVLFTTLAHQLAHRSLGLEWKIADAIKRASPSIGKQSLKSQWDELILKPLQTLRQETLQPKRLIFIIDAFDECHDKETMVMKTDTQQIIHLLQELEGLSEVQVRVLITSRHEDHIGEAFRNLRETSYDKLELRKIAPCDQQSTKKDDITIFLERELSKIRIKANSERPSADDFHRLVEKAGGLFIYAATASKFLTGCRPDLAERRLDRLLEGRTSDRSPESALNQIYSTVLDFYTRDMEEDEKQGEHLLKEILRVIVVLFKPLPVCSLAMFTESQPTAPKEVEQSLEGIRSVIDLPEDPKLPVGLIHLSFYEFLLDKQRCEETGFLVEPSTAHASLFDRCLDIMSDCLHMDMCGLQKPGTFSDEVPSDLIQKCIPPHLQYACRYWVDHLMQIRATQQGRNALADDGKVHELFHKQFLSWVEALILIGELRSVIPMITSLETLTNKRESPGLSAFLYDATRFIRFNAYIIRKSPLQLYYSAILFSPSTSIMRSLFWKPLAEWVVNPPIVNNSWGAELVTLQGHGSRIMATAISPDSKLIVSASYDGTARLWEAATGLEIARVSIRGLRVNSLTVSSDGQTIALGKDTPGILLYDIRTDRLSDLPGYTSKAYSVRFSPCAGSKLLAWLDRDRCTINVQDIRRKQQIGMYKTLDDGSPKIAFTPHGKLVVADCAPGYAKVYVWDIKTGNMAEQFNTSVAIVSMASSHDGTTMAFALAHGPVEIRNIESGAVLASLDAPIYLRKIALSPDGGVLMMVCGNGTMNLWFGKSGVRIPTKLTFELSSFCDIAISNDGKFIVGPLNDNTIGLWDITSSHNAYDCARGRESIGHIRTQTTSSGDFAIDDSGNVTRVWDLNKLKLTFETPSFCVGSSCDGKIVISKGDSIQIWDITTKEQLADFKDAHTSRFSPDGKFLVLLSKNAMQVLEGATWRERARFEIEDDLGFRIQFSKDNKVFLWNTANSSDQRSALYLSHLETGNSSILSHDAVCSNFPINYRLSPDGTLVAFSTRSSGDALYLNLVWLEALEIRRKKVLHEERAGMYDVLFSPDSARVVTSTSETITLWDTATGNMMHTLSTDRLSAGLQINWVDAISLDGKVAFGTSVGLYVWDPVTDEVSDPYPCSFLYKPSFSDDGQYLDARCGRLPLTWSTRHLDCLYIDEDWVYQGRERLLWLPKAYYVPCYKMAVRRGTIFLSLKSGSSTFIKIDLEKTPLAKQQEASSRSEKERTKGKETG
ncbi:WD40 repeat-like protein [Biscogniauxia sp. FL1348]|nr:WD40 repeat-like protein [Biscogniauxia sp. FL1348]